MNIQETKKSTKNIILKDPVTTEQTTKFNRHCNLDRKKQEQLSEKAKLIDKMFQITREENIKL